MKNCDNCVWDRWTCDYFKTTIGDTKFATSAYVMPDKVHNCSQHMPKLSKYIGVDFGVTKTKSENTSTVFNGKFVPPLPPTPQVSRVNIGEQILEMIVKFRQDNANISPNVILISPDMLHRFEKSIAQSLVEYKGIRVDFSEGMLFDLEIVKVNRADYLKVALI